MFAISRPIVALAGVFVMLFPSDAAAQRPDSDAGRDGFFRSGERGWVGLSFRGDQDDPGRIVVTEVLPDSPAEEAGIRPGDEIVSWNGRSDVLAAVSDASLDPGDTVELAVSRDGEERTATVVAERRPRNFTPRPSRAGQGAGARRRGPPIRIEILRDSLLAQADSMRSRLRVLLRDSLGPRLEMLEREGRALFLDADSSFDARGGLGSLAFGRSAVAGAELTDMGPGLAGYFDVEDGVLVLRVAPDTPASRAGLQEGDVIVRAGGGSVADVADLRRAFAENDGNLEMEVARRGNRHIVVVQR